jgi:hypothetical protein
MILSDYFLDKKVFGTLTEGELRLMHKLLERLGTESNFFFESVLGSSPDC